jgi:hypothetical protein
MEAGMFRKSALEKLSSPEQLDQLLQVANPQAWFSVLALVLLVILGLVWSIFGTIATSVSTSGFLIPVAGISQVTAPTNGIIKQFLVIPGERVKAGQGIVRISIGGGRSVELDSPTAGQVIAGHFAPGAFVAAGDIIATEEPVNGPLVAHFFVPLGEASQIHPGMQAQVAPVNVNSETFGYIIGRVTSVSQYPATSTDLMAQVGNSTLVQMFLSGGPVMEVAVSLKTDSGTESGYLWSSSEGPPSKLSAGTLAQVKFVVSRIHPIQFLL